MPTIRMIFEIYGIWHLSQGLVISLLVRLNFTRQLAATSRHSWQSESRRLVCVQVTFLVLLAGATPARLVPAWWPLKHKGPVGLGDSSIHTILELGVQRPEFLKCRCKFRRVATRLLVTIATPDVIEYPEPLLEKRREFSDRSGISIAVVREQQRHGDIPSNAIDQGIHDPVIPDVGRDEPFEQSPANSEIALVLEDREHRIDRAWPKFANHIDELPHLG
jgi:hypothetical protein